MEQSPQEPPLTVWAITINRKVTREVCELMFFPVISLILPQEYALCAKCIDPRAKEKAEKVVDRNDAFRKPSNPISLMGFSHIYRLYPGQTNTITRNVEKASEYTTLRVAIQRNQVRQGLYSEQHFAR